MAFRARRSSRDERTKTAISCEFARAVGAGGLRRNPLSQTKLVTRNNVCIQALGKDQDIRGLKFLDWRPDLVIVDDFEDRDNVATPEGRRKTFTWFRADLLPACQPTSKIRVLSTPMDPESVPMRLSKSVGWDWRIYPVVRRHPETGVEEATWPAQFPRVGWARAAGVSVIRASCAMGSRVHV